MTPSISIIVPCLNEVFSIGEVFQSVENLRVKSMLDGIELLILDDDSDDETATRAGEESKRFPALSPRVIRRPPPRRGYGAVIRYGLAHARGEFVVPLAADMVDPLELIPEFLSKMRSGADLVQCSRYIRAGDSGTIPFKYKFFQAIWRFLVRRMLGVEIPDTTYAFRMFRRTDALSMCLASNGFSLSPEIFFKTLLRGGRIEYIARAQGVRHHGVSKFIFRREGPGYAYVLVRAWLHRMGVCRWV